MQHKHDRTPEQIERVARLVEQLDPEQQQQFTEADARAWDKVVEDIGKPKAQVVKTQIIGGRDGLPTATRTARIQYTLTVVVTGDDYRATDAVDQIEDALKALGEGRDISGTADEYTFTVPLRVDDEPVSVEPDEPLVSVKVKEQYL